jgi:hypothetical protein
MHAIFPKLAVGFVLLAAPSGFLGAAAQPVAIVGTDEVRATVETVHQQKRMVLLSGPKGELLTVHAGPEVRNLPQVKSGDRVVIRFTGAVAARIVRPGEPLPASTTSTLRANSGERPAGMIIDHDHERVTIEGINLPNNTVTFIGSDRVPRTVTVQQPAMREFLRTLKVGDEVDVTYIDAVAISVEPGTR